MPCISTAVARVRLRISGVCASGFQMVVMAKAPGFVVFPELTDTELPKENGPAVNGCKITCSPSCSGIARVSK
ncbi:MAG: hypothetical protein RLZZ200_804 [Pseudomonadota bacterium]